MKKLLIFIALVTLAYAKYYPNALFAKVSGIASHDTLSVRAKPNWHSKKITALPPNAYVGVDECVRMGRSNWCKVHAVNHNLGQDRGYDDRLSGWVNARYLKFSSRGFVAIRGEKSCNYAIGCSGGRCRVANVFDNVTINNDRVVAINPKSYSRRVLKGIGELDIDSGGEGYPCNRRGVRIDIYLSKHHINNIGAKSSAKSFLKALENQNLSEIKSFIHPIYGITITNKISFAEPGARHFSQKSFVKFYKSGTKLDWGRNYGSGERVRKSLKSIISQLIRPVSQISKVSILHRLKGFSGLTTLKGYEFFWQGKGREAHYNWQGVVVILAKDNGKWYIVGLLRDRWVI